jgi:hypothetical protein
VCSLLQLLCPFPNHEIPGANARCEQRPVQVIQLVQKHPRAKSGQSTNIQLPGDTLPSHFNEARSHDAVASATLVDGQAALIGTIESIRVRQ